MVVEEADGGDADGGGGTRQNGGGGGSGVGQGRHDGGGSAWRLCVAERVTTCSNAGMVVEVARGGLAWRKRGDGGGAWQKQWWWHVVVRGDGRGPNALFSIFTAGASCTRIDFAKGL